MAPKSPLTDESIKCGTYVYIVEYYLALKKKILTHATIQLKLEKIKLSGINQSQRTNTV